jgi:hypothetical protein
MVVPEGRGTQVPQTGLELPQVQKGRCLSCRANFEIQGPFESLALVRSSIIMVHEAEKCNGFSSKGPRKSLRFRL